MFQPETECSRRWEVLLRSSVLREQNKALVWMRNQMRVRKGRYRISSDAFSVALSLLQSENDEILTHALSMLGYACLNITYRKRFFSCPFAFKSLSNIIKENKKDDILCRGWRLAGNLMRTNVGQSVDNYHLFAAQLEPDAFMAMSLPIQNCFAMALQYAAKLGLKTPLICDKLMHLLTIADCQENKHYVLSLISKFAAPLRPKSLKFKLTSEHIDLFLDVMKHSDNDMKHLALFATLRLMRALVLPLPDNAYRVAFTYIEFLKNDPAIVNKDCVKIMGFFTTFSNVRNELKHANILPLILQQGVNDNLKIEIEILLRNFQYDTEVMQLCALDGNLVEFLLGALDKNHPFLPILARMATCPKVHPKLLNENALLTLISCGQNVIQSFIRSGFFDAHLLTSGLCWKMSQSGCDLTKMCNVEKSSVFEHLLKQPGNDRRAVCLALPFLFSHDNPSNVSLMFKYFVEFDGFTEILAAVNVDSIGEDVAYCLKELVSLLRVLKFNNSSHEITQKLILGTATCPARRKNDWKPPEEIPDLGNVDILLDDGTRLTYTRSYLSSISPVFYAMLRGNFKESTENCVRWSHCSATAWTAFLKLLTPGVEPFHAGISVKLEVLALADRLLIFDIEAIVKLIAEIRSMDEFYNGYEWCHEEGSLLDNAGAMEIKISVYDTLFKNAGNILRVMSRPTTRNYFITDISDFFQVCSSDLKCLKNRK